MFFAISICIFFGFLIGVFQLIRLDTIDIVWETITPGTPDYITPELMYEKISAWVLIFFAIPIVLSVVLTEPLRLFDFFVPEKNVALTDLTMEFSALKISIVIAAILVGEWITPLLNIHEKIDAHAQEYCERHKDDIDPKSYTRQTHDWNRWQREQSEKRGNSNIPPSQNTDNPQRNAFRILKLSPDATQKQIRLAYIKMAKDYHPDRVLTPDSSPKERARAEEKMKTINTAYDILKRKP